MKKQVLFFSFMHICLLVLSNCIGYSRDSIELFRETRTGSISTNLIGIVGEDSLEPYIEIQYSIKDEARPGYNKTASIWVTPPYVFKNENVYITYEYVELGNHNDFVPHSYYKYLVRDYEEGGAEYLRIINHSPDKPIEFFLAGTHMGEEQFHSIVPQVCYNRTPVYFLLYPDKKYTENIYWNDEVIHYFEGNRTGDLIVTEAWTVDEVAALYRAEYAYSDTMQLTFYNSDYRLMDLVNDKIDTVDRSLRDSIFYSIIQPEEEFRGNERFWLLATPFMFNTRYDEGSLPYVEREW